MSQLSLFPDGFELQERALAALRDLDPLRARTFLRKARDAGAPLPNLEPLDAAIAWLGSRIASPTNAEAVAALLREVPDAVQAGTLSPGAGEFVDQALARYAARHALSVSPFLGATAEVPSAVVDLILGDGARAHSRLREVLDQGHAARADLWGWFADAAWLIGRPEEAAAAWVRALFLDAGQVDLWRCRDARLRELHQHLRERHSTASARELLLSEAFLAGVLPIPAGNRWLDAAAMRAGLEAAPATSAADAPARQRRFARLLYIDRTAGPAAVDVDRREQMLALCPELFARHVAHCRDEERRCAGGPGRRAPSP